MKIFNFIKSIFKKVLVIKPTGSLSDIAVPDTRDIALATVQTPVVIRPRRHATDLSRFRVFNQIYGTCVAEFFCLAGSFLNFKETTNVVTLSRRAFYSTVRVFSKLTEEMGQGLYPRDAAKVAVNIGFIEESEVSETVHSHIEYTSFKMSDEQRKKADKFRSRGFAFVTKDRFAVADAIYQNGFIGASLPYDPSTWLSWFIRKALNIFGWHYIFIYGYEEIESDTRFLFRNSWSEFWGLKGNGEFLWSEYGDSIQDMMVLIDMPNEVIDRARNARYVFLRDLKQGASGDDVKKLQERLIALELLVDTVDGRYGPKLTQAVKDFQRLNGIQETGNFCPLTREAMNKDNEIKIPERIGQFKLYPLVDRKANELLYKAKQKGHSIRITEGYRSLTRQDVLYSQGRTTSGRIVTNAKPGESLHNYGVAFDICFTGKNPYPTNEKVWKEIGQIGKELGFEWGGDWKTFRDMPHFELTLDYNVSDFKNEKVDLSRYA